MNRKLGLVVAGFFLAFPGCSKSTNEPSAPPAASQPAAPPSPIPGYDIVQVNDGGSITGVISVSGPIPRMAKRDIKKDPKVCGTTARESQQLLVSTGGGLKNAIVTVEDVKHGKALPATFENPQINQSRCEYTPHVMVMPVNAEIAILNSDPILHNIHFYQNDESLFNIAQPVQNQVNKHKLEKTGMVYAECDVHSWMQGHVAVVNNPYFAITDETGKFSIEDLPPGTYKVKVWHEYLGEKAQDVTVSARTSAPLNLDLKDLLTAKKPAPEKTTETPATASPKSGDKKAASAAEVIVKMVSDGNSFRFEPAELSVKVGTTVKWLNDSDNRHTATDDPKLEKTPGEAQIPQGVEPWSSPFLVNGDSFTRVFSVPGTYRYFCRNHGQFGMEGTIKVGP